MRLKFLNEWKGLPAPSSPARKTAESKKTAPVFQAPPAGKPERPLPPPARKPPVKKIEPEKPVPPKGNPEEEFIEIIARQVRDFSPDVLRMQLTGFARKYRSGDKAIAEKAALVAKMLIDGDALAGFFYHNNECLKGIPLPDVEMNASYVIIERNTVRIMVVDGKVTFRKRLRLIPSVMNAVKRSIYRAFLDEEFRKKYSPELQEYLIVNSFFYDNRNAERNIRLSTLPEKQKAVLRSILSDIQKAVKQASGSSAF